MNRGNPNAPEKDAIAEFITEFGEILKESGVHNIQDDKTEGRLDTASADLARFLRASRLALGLSIAELASQSGLSEAEIVCLENAIIPSKKISNQWLCAL